MIILNDDFNILKRILLLFRPYIKKVAAILICIIASAGISMILPLISKQLMDNGLLVHNFKIVVRLSLVSFILIVIDQCLGVLETRYLSYISSVMSYSLTKAAFKHSLKLKIQFFKNTGLAELMKNIDMDVGNVSRVADRSTFFIVSQVFRIVGGIIGLVLIDWKLTLLVIGIVPVRYIAVKYLASKRKELFKTLMSCYSDYAAWYGDTINGIREIKLWGIDRIKIGQFNKKQREIIKINIKSAVVDKMNEFSESVLLTLIANALYIIGANMVFGGGLSIGGLFAFVTYSVYVTAPVSAILNIGYSFSNVVPSAKRLFNFLDMEREANGTRGVELDCNLIKGNIKIDNIGFSYSKEVPILKNISFEVNKGEKVAIVGTNGSGKSTILNLLLRLYTPDRGRILIDDIDISQIKLRDYRQLISVVSQDLYLFNTTVKENISLSSRINDVKIFRAAKESLAHEFIEAMPQKYETVVGNNGMKLSGGQRQKLAMARAFARDSKILLLDEATSNFDMESEMQINELLSMNFKDRTIIVVTHKPDILKKVDKVIMLEEGRVLDMGKHDELLERNEFYRDMINGERKNNKNYGNVV